MGICFNFKCADSVQKPLIQPESGPWGGNPFPVKTEVRGTAFGRLRNTVHWKNMAPRDTGYGHGGDGLVLGLGDLRGLLQAFDSMIIAGHQKVGADRTVLEEHEAALGVSDQDWDLQPDLCWVG